MYITLWPDIKSLFADDGEDVGKCAYLRGVGGALLVDGLTIAI